VQSGDTLEARVGPGHRRPHITEVLSVDSSTAVPMASRRSSAQATRCSVVTAIPANPSKSSKNEPQNRGAAKVLPDGFQ
jgi:hypothetical protein